MGVISKDNRQIKLYYNSEASLGKQTLSYIKASEKKVLAIDISKTNVTGTQWVEIVDNLNIPISELVNQEHPDFVKVYGDKKVDLNENDWLKIVEKHPTVISNPIVIYGNKFIKIETPSDFTKCLDQE